MLLLSVFSICSAPHVDTCAVACSVQRPHMHGHVENRSWRTFETDLKCEWSETRGRRDAPNCGDPLHRGQRDSSLSEPTLSKNNTKRPLSFFSNWCAQSTTPKTLLADKVMPLPVPEHSWSHMAVDFVTDLSPSDGFTTVQTIVDCFS